MTRADSDPRDVAGTSRAVAPPPTPPLAIAAFVTGLLGVTCLPGSGGLVAIVLALLARSEARSAAPPRPRLALANAGLALGALSVLLTVGGLVWLFALVQEANLKPARPRPRSTATVAAPRAAAPRSTTLPAPRPRERLAEADAQHELRRTETVRVGRVLLTDLGPDSGDLRAALTEQQRLAEREQRTLLLWLNGADCAPCDGVAAALLDPRLQRALASTLLVRVDVAEFSVELAHLGIPTESIPGFARLDTNHRPVDYLHGGEWDADVAENIAPVLRSFVRGDPMHRRHPWRTADTRPPTPI